MNGRIPDTDHIVGLFMNSVVLRFARAPSVDQYVRTATAKLFGAMDNSDWGFSQIRRLADPEVTPADFSWPILFTHQTASHATSTGARVQNVTSSYTAPRPPVLKAARSVVVADVVDGFRVRLTFAPEATSFLDSNSLLAQWQASEAEVRERA